MPTIAALLVLLVGSSATAQSQQEGTLSAERRAYVAARIYASVRDYFAHWQGTSGPETLDGRFKAYLAEAMAAPDRTSFDLASLKFLASFKNHHTRFLDTWLRHTNDRLGFDVGRVEGKWVVRQSDVPALKVGDVIEAVDGEPVASFVARQSQYVSASRTDLREENVWWPYLLPLRFTLTLADGRRVELGRVPMPKDWKVVSATAHLPTYKWLVPQQIAYLRLKSFGAGVGHDAAEALHGFSEARVLIIDLRGNVGGGGEEALLAALMERPYRSPAGSTSLRIGLFDFLAQQADLPEAQKAPPWERGVLDGFKMYIPGGTFGWSAKTTQPKPGAYTGKIFMLIDKDCGSAGEDFAMQFKDNQRATLVGEATAGGFGQAAYFDLGDGMSIWVGTERDTYPDGQALEGVGVEPDISIPQTIDDLKTGRDGVLERTLGLAREAVTTPSHK